MARDTRETAAARKFIATVSDLDFRPGPFAVFVSQQSRAVQERVLDLFMCFVDHMSMKLDESLWVDNEDLELCVKAKRMQDAMVPFR